MTPPRRLLINVNRSATLPEQIVKRLCQQPPRGLSWKEFAVREIARNLNAFARERANSPPTTSAESGPRQ